MTNDLNPQSPMSPLDAIPTPNASSLSPEDPKLENQKGNAKQKLVDAAVELFTKKSYDEVSTRELALKAGVNLGAIQYHFGSKAKLFVEAVNKMMESELCEKRALSHLGEGITSRQDAACRIGQFIYSYLDDVLHPQGPQVCRIMFREIFTNTSEDQEMFEALTSAAVDKFIRPLDSVLIDILKLISPDLSQVELERSVQSIFGQCVYYISHKPFIERLRGTRVEDAPYFTETISHILKFSLRALRCDENFINQVVTEVLKKNLVS